MSQLNEIKKIIDGEAANAILHFKQEMAALRSSRPTPALVEDIPVEYYQDTMPLKQLAAIKVQPPSSIIIEPWDKSSLNAIIQAIASSQLGLAPIADGDSIRLSLPPLSQDRRAQLIKLLNENAEAARIKIRQGREKANKRTDALFKEKQISEDERFSFKEAVQKSTDEHIEAIKKLVEHKEKELMQ